MAGIDAQMDWNGWAQDVSESLGQGARASCAQVFVSAGGSSYGLWAVWPDAVLDRLADPSERARLAVMVESELPGWLWSASTAPRAGERRAWSKACYSLVPPDQADGRAVARSVSSRPGSGGQLAAALSRLDAFAGSPSWRVGYEMGWTPEDLLRAEAPSERSILTLENLCSAMGARGFGDQLRSQACRLQLDAAAGSGERGSGPTRM